MLKEPTTYIQQIELLKNKGFIIDDPVDCIEFLKEANYYRFSAYFLPFQIEKDIYRPNINFNQLKKIYYFDSEIRAILFQAMEQIEFYLRSQIAYTIAHKYGSQAYLDREIYLSKHNHEAFLDLIKKCISDNMYSDFRAQRMNICSTELFSRK